MQYSTLVSTIEKAGTVARSFLSLAVQKHNLPNEVGLLRLALFRCCRNDYAGASECTVW